mgnify:CR=1 FL=1
MKIALDFDDVCTDTHAYKLAAFRQRLNDCSFEVASRATLVESGLITPEEYRRIQTEIYLDVEGSLEGLKFKTECVESIKALIAAGHQVSIVTARDGVTLDIARTLLNREGLELPMIGVGYGNSKTEALQDFDVFIDDDPNHVAALLGTGKRLFLMSTQENSNFEHPEILRVNNWEEFLSKLLEEA